MIAPARPSGAARRRRAPDGDETWAPVLDEVATLQAPRRTRGSRPAREDPGVVRQRSRGKLTCRERIDLLLDHGIVPRGGQPGRLRQLRRRRRDRRLHARQPRRRLGRIEGRTAASSAPTTSPRAAATPTGRSAPRARYLDRLSIELRVAVGPPARRLVGRRQRRRDGARAEAGGREHGQGELAAPSQAGRPRVAGGGGSFLPGHLGSTDVRRAARHRAGRQRAARQRGRHRRGQGGARALLGDGARHRPAVRGRAAGGQPRHGLRHHQGGPRRLAHPLPQRLGRQPRRDRGGGDGDDAAVPLLPALERLRGAAGAGARPERSAPTGATRSCSRSSRASARRRSTCAAPSG